jgi:excinuclease UvrABC nuclease subunit
MSAVAVSNQLSLLRETARALPESPGVYFWEDEDGCVLYIGKAVNLRNRVMSYFSSAGRDRRVRELVTSAARIRHEVTSTELEALFRESALIKQYKPQFNRALLTSKPAFYLKIDRTRHDPFLETSRTTEDGACLYFGPFRSGRALRETIAFLHDVLPLRKCTAQKPRCKPCIYYQMHTCAAPALDDLHRIRHEEAIDRLFDLLDGREDRVTRWLEAKRDRLSDALLFERAADIQDRLDVFQEIQKRNAIMEAAMQCRCVLVSHQPSADSTNRLLLVAHGHVISTRESDRPDPDDIARWTKAHEPVIRALTDQQSPVDAALVFQRWLSTKRKTVRWVAFKSLDNDEDVAERVRYVLGQESLVPAGIA